MTKVTLIYTLRLESAHESCVPVKGITHVNMYTCLQEDCEGHFTTNPNSIKLYLPEILEHFGNDFPLEAMLYIRPETSDDLPLHLTSDIITLTHTEIESSIIASTCWEYEKQELSEEDRALVAIPTNLDIEVTFLGKESEDEQLYESTKSYFEKFSHLKITSMKNSGGMHRGAGPAQKKLYKVVREGFESSGTEIRMPYRISGVFEGEVSPLTKFMGKLIVSNPTYLELRTNEIVQTEVSSCYLGHFRVSQAQLC